jgi:hypothetical protein
MAFPSLLEVQSTAEGNNDKTAGFDPVLLGFLPLASTVNL